MTLSYYIKYGDISFFQHAIREITIIFWVSIAKKLKYTRIIMRQVYIFDTKAFDP